MTVTTLGPMSDEQIIDGLGPETTKHYIHHYNFPGYSVGEAKPIRSPGRREIGHGALAERALVPVIPSTDEFPYTIRLVSEILESNGSSSMGSVCGSTLSLMQAGVPIKRPVSGVAMGLVKEGDAYTILTDIQGMEDALGDMDFKVAGTEKGVTAIQMDIKVDGIDRNILSSALQQAIEVIVGNAFVSLVAEQAYDVWMLLGVCLADGLGVVGRCILPDDNLKGHMALLHQNGIDGPRDGVLLVIGEDDD